MVENCDRDVFKLSRVGFSLTDLIFVYFLDFLVFSSDCSPGPGYKIDARITRAGVDGTPSYSMLGRQRDQRKYLYHRIL